MRGHSEHGGHALRPPDLDAYRAAVADLLLDIAGQGGGDDATKAEAILVERTGEPEIAGVLAATPDGSAEAVERLLAEVRRFRPGLCGGVADLGALVRAVLLSQIEQVWWGHLPPYHTDQRLRAADELADVEVLRRHGRIGFRYRRPAGNVLIRAVQEVHRWARPDHAPPCPSSRCARARPEIVAVLNQVAGQLAERTNVATAPLWVNGLARSQRRQRRLYEQGYPEFLPSAHCVGYAADVEMAWLRRFGAHGTLAALLLERQRAGEANVIDEGPTWHVCVSPYAAAVLRRDFEAHIGSCAG